MGLFTKKKTARVKPQTKTAENATSDLREEKQTDAEASELIAVVAAAIAAYEAESYRRTLDIKKISRLAGARPVWATAGAQEAIDARRI